MIKSVVLSGEYKSRRDELMKESNREIPSPTYKAICNRVEVYGHMDNSSITRELLQRLYVVEQRTDTELARLFGLTTMGMESKRRRLGIPDNPTTFNKILKCSETAFNELGNKAFKL